MKKKEEEDYGIIDKKRVKTSHTHVSRDFVVVLFFGLVNWIRFIHTTSIYTICGNIRPCTDAMTFVDRKINIVTETRRDDDNDKKKNNKKIIQKCVYITHTHAIYLSHNYPD